MDESTLVRKASEGLLQYAADKWEQWLDHDGDLVVDFPQALEDVLKFLLADEEDGDEDFGTLIDYWYEKLYDNALLRDVKYEMKIIAREAAKSHAEWLEAQTSADKMLRYVGMSRHDFI